MTTTDLSEVDGWYSNSCQMVAPRFYMAALWLESGHPSKLQKGNISKEWPTHFSPPKNILKSIFWFLNLYVVYTHWRNRHVNC